MRGLVRGLDELPMQQQRAAAGDLRGGDDHEHVCDVLRLRVYVRMCVCLCV